MQPSSLTTATAMGSVLLAGRRHFTASTPPTLTTVTFLHSDRLSSISLVRNHAPMTASARGLTGPSSTKGCSFRERMATCSRGYGADCLAGPSPRMTDLTQSAPTRSRSWFHMQPALMCSLSWPWTNSYQSCDSLPASFGTQSLSPPMAKLEMATICFQTTEHATWSMLTT